MLSRNYFLYILSKDLIVSWSRSYGFFYLLYLFMIILCNILLPKDRRQAIPANMGKTIKLIPAIDKIIEIDDAPVITIESIDSNSVFGVL